MSWHGLVMKTEIDKEQTNNNNGQTIWKQLPTVGRFLLKQKYAKMIYIYIFKKEYLFGGAFILILPVKIGYQVFFFSKIHCSSYEDSQQTHGIALLISITLEISIMVMIKIIEMIWTILMIPTE